MNESDANATNAERRPRKRLTLLRASTAGVFVIVASLVVYLMATKTPASPNTAAAAPTIGTASPGNGTSGAGTTPVSPATTGLAGLPPPKSEATLVYQGPGVIVVGVSPTKPGQLGTKAPHLYMTTDGTVWNNITPPIKGVNGSYPVFEHASFLNASTGWVTAWNPGTIRVTIYKTADGGQSWTSVSGGSNGPAATVIIDLVTPQIAYRESLAPTGPGEEISVTTNAGATWTTVYKGPPPVQAGQRPNGPFMLSLTFSSTTNGFAAAGLPLVEQTTETGYFFHTTDGGASWTAESPPLPIPTAACPATASAQADNGCVYGLPTFSNSTDGVLPTAAIGSGNASVTFDTTSDGGATWTKGATVTVAMEQPSYPVGGTAPPSVPLVSMPAHNAWWVMGWNSSELVSMVSTNAGSNWNDASASVLSAGMEPRQLAALNAQYAVLLVTQPTSGGAFYRLVATTDGGLSWHPLGLG